MSRDLAFGGGLAGSVWALFQFGFIHSPEIIGVVGPLLRLAQRYEFLPAAPIRNLWLVATVAVLLYGLYRFLNSAAERFLQ